MAKNSEKPEALPRLLQPVVRDRYGKAIAVGDCVTIYDYLKQDDPVTGVLVYDLAFWAYAVHGDDGKRYLLMDFLHTCIDPGDGGFAWKEIESSNAGSEGLT